MDKTLVVAVFAPTTDQDCHDLGDSSGEIGTGFYISADLILTARHVAKPDNRNTKHPLAIAWPALTPGRDQPLQWKQDDEVELVWSSNDGLGDGAPDTLDAALIRCPLPKQLAGGTPGILSDRVPSGPRQWESRGFPAVMKRGDVRRHFDFSGSINTAIESDHQFSMSETIAAGKPEAWQGASGMPVGIPRSAEVMGIVVEVPTKLDNRLFHAIPSHRLLADEGFRDACSTALNKRYQQQTAGKVARQLSAVDSSVLIPHLVNRFAIQQGEVQQQPEKIADAMLQHCSEEELLDVGVTAQPIVGAVAGRALQDLILTVLPARQQQELVDRLRQLRFKPEEAPLTIPASLPTVAEFLMAATDQRTASFRAMQNEDEFPSGADCLSRPPEGGRDPDGKQLAIDLLRDLVGLHDAEAGDGIISRFTEFLRHSELVQPDLRDHEWTDLRDHIVRALRRAAEKKQHSYYFIVSQKAQKIDPVLRALKQTFPHLVFLRLAGGTLGDEEDRYGGLRDLLFQNQNQEQQS